MVEKDIPDLPEEARGPKQENEAHYEVIDKESGEIRFIKDEPFYRTLKHALMTAGFDIDSIRTEREHDDIVYRRYGDHVEAFITARAIAMKHKSLERAILAAILQGDHAEAQRLLEKLERRKAAGLRVIPPSDD
jgi:hypothetical protein